MNKSVMVLFVFLSIISTYAQATNKFIGAYSTNANILTLLKNGKCTYIAQKDNIPCKWSEKKRYILVGKKEFKLNIESLNNDVLTVTSPSKGNRKDRLYKINGTTWNSIVGNYKCSGIIVGIDLKNDGTYTSGIGSGNWGLKRKGAIRLLPYN